MTEIIEKVKEIEISKENRCVVPGCKNSKYESNGIRFDVCGNKCGQILGLLKAQQGLH
jgi:hypothetical protein